VAQQGANDFLLAVPSSKQFLVSNDKFQISFRTQFGLPALLATFGVNPICPSSENCERLLTELHVQVCLSAQTAIDRHRRVKLNFAIILHSVEYQLSRRRIILSRVLIERSLLLNGRIL
jgi:hypothetical protein